VLVATVKALKAPRAATPDGGQSRRWRPEIPNLARHLGIVREFGNQTPSFAINRFPR